jgi:hypothetical protein
LKVVCRGHIVVRRCRKLGRDASRKFRKAKHLNLGGNGTAESLDIRSKPEVGCGADRV